MMSQNRKPLITIVGALSKQGRSAAHTLLQSGRYRVRALTRRVDAPEAQSLARQGAELVTVPLELGHKRELVDAFRGSQGGFLMSPPVAPPATAERGWSASASAGWKTARGLPAARNGPRTSPTKPKSRSTFAPCPSPARLS